MNLVDKYLEEIVFPFHKILNWHFEQRIERDMAPVYTMGSTDLRSFSLGNRTTREAHITLIGLTPKEWRLLSNKREVKDLTLTHKDSTLYIQRGVVKSFRSEEPSIIPDSSTRFELVIDCVEVAINAYPPVSGHEHVIELGDRSRRFREEFRREYMANFIPPIRTEYPPTNYNREHEDLIDRIRDSFRVSESAAGRSYSR